MNNYNVGIDIGGTNVKGVLIRQDEIVYQQTHETKDGTSHWQESITKLYEELKHHCDGHIATIGLSAPGIAGENNRSIAFMPGRLQGLEDFDWSAFIGEEVYVLNDAHAALWAEAIWGAARGSSNIVMLTLGTGVGGGLLLEGKLHQGFLKRAGHLGHVGIEASDNYPSTSGITGSLEEAIGEVSLQRRSLNRFARTSNLVKAYQAGDIWATHVWLSSVRKLALSIVSFINAFSPDLVVIAGGITKAGDDLQRPLQAFMDIYEWRPGGHATPIRIAHYLDYAGAIGAALYARDQIHGQ
jgi:glucokinase